MGSLQTAVGSLILCFCHPHPQRRSGGEKGGLRKRKNWEEGDSHGAKVIGAVDKRRRGNEREVKRMREREANETRGKSAKCSLFISGSALLVTHKKGLLRRAPSFSPAAPACLSLSLPRLCVSLSLPFLLRGDQKASGQEQVGTERERAEDKDYQTPRWR